MFMTHFLKHHINDVSIETSRESYQEKHWNKNQDIHLILGDF